MSLELVLLVPVLVLLTVFVLWAGRGGQVALTADLAAEEAATAAALCCEEDSGGAAGREALVEDVLEARPGLGFLCIGGPRPDAGGGSDGFLSEHWLKFEPGRDTGGVGVLGVQFLCETDGAVAPLRGLFPTVTFHGQAAEVVLREPRFIVGFEPTRVEVTEGTDAELVFTVVVEPAFGEDVTLSYGVVDPDTTVESGDFQGTDFADLTGTVEIPTGESSAQIVLRLVDDGFYEGTEELVLNLTGVACGCRKPGRGWSSRMSVLADGSVASCRFHGLEVLVWLVRRVGRVRGVGAHDSVVGADPGFRAPSGDQESVRDLVHEDSASAPIAAGQRPRQSFRHP